MEEGIYYKKGGKIEFAGVEILPVGKDIPRIVIERITYHETLAVSGKQEKGMWTATFAKNPYTNLDILLNSTNRKRIAKQFWDAKVEDGTMCQGRINLLRHIPVRLTMESTRDVADGGMTFGLRISKIPAEALPELTKDKIEGCRKWLAEGHSMDELKDIYQVSAEIEKVLTEKTKK